MLYICTNMVLISIVLYWFCVQINNKRQIALKLRIVSTLSVLFCLCVLLAIFIYHSVRIEKLSCDILLHIENKIEKGNSSVLLPCIKNMPAGAWSYRHLVKLSKDITRDNELDISTRPVRNRMKLEIVVLLTLLLLSIGICISAEFIRIRVLRIIIMLFVFVFVYTCSVGQSFSNEVMLSRVNLCVSLIGTEIEQNPVQLAQILEEVNNELALSEGSRNLCKHLTKLLESIKSLKRETTNPSYP